MDKRVFIYSVITGLIASGLFAWFIVPITEWLWHAASNGAYAWLDDLQTQAFTNASLGKRDWVSVVAFTIFSTTFIGVLCGFIAAAWLSILLGSKAKAVIRNNEVKKNINRIFLIFSTIAIFYFTFMIYKLTFIMRVDLQINASFSQRLDALGPYLVNDEEKRLKSAWALMKTRNDYDKIVSKMEEIAIRADIKLPQPLQFN